MSDFYVLLDAMGIQDYIFDTNKLKIILGGSLALARWQADCERICKSGKIITSAGGNFLASFSDQDKDKALDKAIAFKDAAIEKRPDGTEISWAITEAKTTPADTWKDLQQEIARYKAGDRLPKDYPPLSAPAMPGCDYCGTRGKQKELKIDGDEKAVCSICQKKHGLGGELEEASGGTPIEIIYKIPKEAKLAPYPGELDELVSTAGEEREALAIVVVDLNNMGNKVKGIVEKEGFDKLKSFSKDLEKKFTELFSETIKEIGQPETGVDKEKQFIRIRPLFLSGDDALFAMPASLWVPFIRSIFSRLMGDSFFSNQEISASAGIAIAKYTYPVSRLARMAEELVRSAKNVFRWHKKQTSTLYDCALDWHMHEESSFSSPHEVRKRNYVLSDGKITYEIATRKPYLWSRFTQLQDDAKKLMDGDYSNRKLFTLHHAIRSGVRSTRDALVYHFLRDEKEDISKFEDSKYRDIWGWVSSGGGDGHPLWERTQFDRAGDKLDLYDTEMADILELLWFIQPASDASWG